MNNSKRQDRPLYTPPSRRVDERKEIDEGTMPVVNKPFEPIQEKDLCDGKQGECAPFVLLANELATEESFNQQLSNLHIADVTCEDLSPLPRRPDVALYVPPWKTKQLEEGTFGDYYYLLAKRQID
jgi:hypothetical protein